MTEYRVREHDEAFDKRYAEDFTDRPNICHGLTYDTMLKSRPPWYVYVPCEKTPTRTIDNHEFCDKCYEVYNNHINPPRDYFGEFMDKLKSSGYFGDGVPSSEKLDEIVNMVYKDDKMISPEEMEELAKKLISGA